jgi:hypothetical protein
MDTPLDLDDKTLLQQIEECTLNPNFFTHVVLLRLAWILIQEYGLEEALEKNRTIKERYFTEVLDREKFNVPLTDAYVEILHHFMQQSHTKDFYKLLREFPRLRYNFKLLVRTHYGYDILKEHRREEPKPQRPILFTF